MSEKFEKVKYYFDHKHWTLKMVQNAVVKGWITEEEFTQITGLEYESI
jgi:hypothetical protein